MEKIEDKAAVERAEGQNMIYEKVRRYIEDNRMIPKGTLVLAGVSGGGDSMAMLHILWKLSGELDFFLEAVHVHHGIRGPEADRDMAMAEGFCHEKGIPWRVYRFSVPGLAEEWKLGLEETGRLVRRQAFGEEEKRLGVKGRIALAHNQNDLAETILHNLARGTGLRGLAGIRPVNENIVRPVLCLERWEIDHYLKENGIPYATDSSNLGDDYTRNRIRHHILPLLEREINPGAVAHMAAAGDMLAQADHFLGKCAGILLEGFWKEDGSILLNGEFFKAEPILQSYGVLEALVRLAGKRKDLSAVHISQVLGLKDKINGRKILLPYGLEARKEYEGVRVRKWQEKEMAGDISAAWELPHSGILHCPLGDFYTEIFEYFGQKISEKKYTKWLDYDKIKDNLSVRTRKAGDYLVINEEGARKKIRRCMIDDKIPEERRGRIPLVVCGEEVLWMVGGRISGKYRITPNTKRVLEVRYQGGTQDE